LVRPLAAPHGDCQKEPHCASRNQQYRRWGPEDRLYARLPAERELAAVHISDAKLDQLEALVLSIATANVRDQGTENADRDFQLLIARAARNT
jgi:DNA-binding FadR family transcriptional regulator